MDHVRRFFAFGLAWLAAAVVATVVAWQGVGLIGDQVTGDTPATLSASQIDEQLRSTTTDAPASSSSAPRRTTRTTAPGAPAGRAPSGTAAGGGTGTGPGTTTPSTAAPTAPPPRPAPAVTKTFSMTGGTAALRFSPQGVTVVYATPKPGFQLTKNEPGDNNGWRVEFEGQGVRSRVDGWWDNGPEWSVQDDGATAGDDRGPGGG